MEGNRLRFKSLFCLLEGKKRRLLKILFFHEVLSYFHPFLHLFCRFSPSFKCFPSRPDCFHLCLMKPPPPCCVSALFLHEFSSSSHVVLPFEPRSSTSPTLLNICMFQTPSSSVLEFVHKEKHFIFL